MQNKHEIIELFPIPVYTTTIPETLSSVTGFFDQQEMGTGTDHDNFGFRSKDSYILDKPECSELSNFILSNVKIYTEYLGYDYDEYRFGQSWISIKTPGQQHSTHVHPNSLISGVLYYGPSTEKTSAIKFHKFKAGVNVPHIAPKMVQNAEKLKYAQDSYNIIFEPGLLILFPPHLMHSVPLNKTDKPRCSLAFNIVPKVGFGDERFLTELIF